MPKVLFVIAPEKFRDEELFHTKSELEAAGIETDIASTKVGECHGMLGGVANATVSLEDVDIALYDAIVFVGGAGTPIVRASDTAVSIAKKAYEEGKIVCAICWAPTILAKSGILKGRNATVWYGDDQEYGKTTDEVLEQFGARFVDAPVVVDGKIITANGPAAAKEFGKRIAEMLNA